jgi:hypothetical protein
MGRIVVFQGVARHRGEHEASICREILQRVEQHDLKAPWGKGAKDSSSHLRFELGGSSILWFSSAEPPFNDEDKRLELLARLNQFPASTLDEARSTGDQAFHSRFWLEPARLKHYALRWGG